jgi:hypothetical protein
MKCPLLVMGQIAHQGVMIASENDCFKGECAWWGNNSQQCAINKIGAELYVIGEVLEEIRDKMLHEKERLV